jgi:hypothetical protein
MAWWCSYQAEIRDLVVLTLLVAVAALAADGPPQPSTFIRPPMAGRLVDIDCRRLHVRCTGTQGPTVVWKAALGM